ncbi:Sec-independent protein translocase protein TatCy [mine drainage metagenome]|uniref:Sec-independent protein translocase protein TatCy n=1 Tax=mine drainage metagenome TaxID=410659 RepID=A0A1J5QML5_9ZZZZ
MPLLAHLRELRRRVVISSISILTLSSVGWIEYRHIIKFLAAPICDLRVARGAANCGILYINGILGPINLQIRIALISGIVLAAPIWLYQLWAFTAPGLHKRERKWTLLFVVVATPFFAAGATVAVKLLPIAVRMLIGFTPSTLSNLIKFDDYLDFVTRLTLLFGLSFEMPVILVALNLAGVLAGRTILGWWRIAVFLIFLFAAAFTPTADPLTMTLLALPLCIFFFAAAGIALLVDRRRAKRAAKSAVGDDEISPIEPPEAI